MISVLVVVLSVLVVSVLAGDGLRAGRLGWMDRWEAAGVAGLLGLGLAGTLGFLLGMFTAAAVPVAVIGFLAGMGIWGYRRRGPTPMPTPHWIPLLVLGFFGVISAAAPSTSSDWDTIAYHLAVPKLWFQAGRIVEIPFIHHSYFPFAFDTLFLVTPNSQAVAKSFTVVASLLGLLAIYGIARRRVGSGIWAAWGFVGIPMVVWLTGTGYIDIPHGLACGLAMLYAGEYLAGLRRGGPEPRPRSGESEPEALTADLPSPDLRPDAAETPSKVEAFLLAGMFLGLACATKYTGLVFVLAVCFCLGVGLLVARQSLARAVGPPLLLAALAIGWMSPWLVRNVVLTGNPVYPFLYERLGGDGWDQWRADIYRNEQQTFGVGRTESGRDLTRIPHAILGLGYQPGRYVNPGQETGGGLPFGAVGGVILLAPLLWLIRGRRETVLAYGLACAGLGMFLWFFLSQQSRYATALIPVSLVCLACLARDPRWRVPLAGLIVLQVAYGGLYLGWIQAQPRVAVAVGTQTREDYFKTMGFGWPEAAQEMTQELRKTQKEPKVALFEEVFGYYLDIPYLWGNPGHSTLVRFEQYDAPQPLMARYRELGVTHIYINFRYIAEDQRRNWSGGGVVPYQGEQREAMMADVNRRWLVLFADAVVAGELRPMRSWGNDLLLEVSKPTLGGGTP